MEKTQIIAFLNQLNLPSIPHTKLDLSDVVDYFSDEQLAQKTLSNEDWMEAIEACAREQELIYDSDCSNFLTSNKIPHEWDDAIDNGAKSLATIANYYYPEYLLETLTEQYQNYQTEIAKFTNPTSKSMKKR